MNKVTLERVPPQEMDAERAVLGAILLSGGKDETLALAQSRLGNGLRFYREAHCKIFDAMESLAEKDEPVDLVTVQQELLRTDDLEKIGGVGYLDALQDSCPSTANVGYYADIVMEMAMRRRLIYSTSTAYDEAFNSTIEVDTVIARLEESLIQLRQEEGISELQPLKTVLKPVFKEIQRVYDSKELVNGLATGLSDLDNLTSGFQRGEYILLAARPGMGKTTLARGMAQHVALELNTPVLIFSIEASRRVVVGRMLASLSEVKYHNLRRGFLSELAWPALTISATKLMGCPIFIDDSPDLTPSQIRAKCQMFMANHRTGLIIIDHIHDVVPDESLRSREQELTKISRSFKAMARSLDVPVLAVAQLNRATESRQDKRPSLSDLRGSGSLEQHGDLVMFLYRDDYYPDRERDQEAELIVAKQRNGPVGLVKLVYSIKSDLYVNSFIQESREIGEEG